MAFFPLHEQIIILALVFCILHFCFIAKLNLKVEDLIIITLMWARRMVVLDDIVLLRLRFISFASTIIQVVDLLLNQMLKASLPIAHVINLSCWVGLLLQDFEFGQLLSAWSATDEVGSNQSKLKMVSSASKTIIFNLIWINSGPVLPDGTHLNLEYYI
jgi:hypothetical protein